MNNIQNYGMTNYQMGFKAKNMKPLNILVQDTKQHFVSGSLPPKHIFYDIPISVEGTNFKLLKRITPEEFQEKQERLLQLLKKLQEVENSIVCSEPNLNEGIIDTIVV